VNITSQYDQIAMLNFQRIQEENSQILKKPVAAFELAHIFFPGKNLLVKVGIVFFKDISH
jgi:hypothetical protein